MWILGTVGLGRVVTVALLAAGLGQGGSAGDTARAVHLLERATYGVRGEELRDLLVSGRDVWLERQLHPEQIADRGVEARLSEFPVAAMSAGALYRKYPPAALVQRLAGDTASAEQRRMAAMGPARIAAELAGAKLVRAVYTERQLEEVMTDFWFNHFNVFLGKGLVRWLAGDYERSAIRPYVFGKFENMLFAVASHPAMLFYLDNWMSSAERPAQQGRPGAGEPQGGRRRGINENYARELLELHTLGVDGGYSQQDVIEVARVFTGWTLTRPGGRGEGEFAFTFRPAMHDRGEKVILGRRFPSGRGVEEGREVLRLLASHPATARHIARKLAERFVSDEPPAALVDTLAAVFIRTDGDLREVTRALYTAEAFFDPAVQGGRIKRPFELVVSALRASGAEVGGVPPLLQVLRTLGHLPYQESAPTGYPSRKEEWVNSGALLNRMNFGLALSAGQLRGVRVPEELLEDAVHSGSREELIAILARRVFPAGGSRDLEAIVLEDLAANESSNPERLARRALGLLLGSPQFQRH